MSAVLLHNIIHVIKEPLAVDLFNVACFEEWEKKAAKIANNTSFHGPRFKREDLLGELFELFTQLFCMEFSGSIGIYDYEPNEEGSLLHRPDYGIDGFCLNKLGEKAVTQSKFRTNPSYQLTQNEDHAYNMILQTWHDPVYQPDKSNADDIRHFIITNCKGVHPKVMEQYGEKTCCINRKEILKHLKNNKMFWKRCQTKIKASFQTNNIGGQQ